MEHCNFESNAFGGMTCTKKRIISTITFGGFDLAMPTNCSYSFNQTFRSTVSKQVCLQHVLQHVLSPCYWRLADFRIFQSDVCQQRLKMVAIVCRAYDTLLCCSAAAQKEACRPCSLPICACRM